MEKGTCIWTQRNKREMMNRNNEANSSVSDWKVQLTVFADVKRELRVWKWKKKETKQHENWKTNHREISCTGCRCPDVDSGSCRGGLWGKRPRIAHAGHTCSQFKWTHHRAQLSSSATLLAPLGRHLDKGIKHQKQSREQKQQETAKGSPRLE